MTARAIVLFTLINIISSVDLVHLSIDQGVLEGETLISFKDQKYYSFKGIPYADPPIGSFRFEAPQPAQPWEGVRNATVHGSKCPQIDIFTNEIIPGDEDCLFLNVYSPKLNPLTLLPVMVFIHGGGFKSGSGNDDSYGPRILMDYGIVLVTFNYRLEVLGFLSLETKEVPGNAGMKDQVAALRWVKKNIAKFGGDPENVTIFGQSAGGASVAYHILSPLSAGLFQRAISMSGTPFCDFAMPFRPKQRAFILGKQLGLHTNDTTVLLNHLQKMPKDKLYNTKPTILTSEEITDNILKMYQFVPVVEKNNYGTAFLAEDPRTIIKNKRINDVDMMFGHTDKETILILDAIVSSYLEVYDRYPEMIVPTKILVKHKPDTNLEVSARIREYYFQNKTIDINTLKEFITFTTDSFIEYDVNGFIKLLSEISTKSRFLYRFSMTSDRNYYGNQGLRYNISGAAHLDDTLYLFEAKSLNQTLEKDSEEYTLIDKMCTLFTNFAKYGNPTPINSLEVKWPQYDNENKFYMDIGNDLEVGTALDAEVVEFWNEIFKFVGLEYYP